MALNDEHDVQAEDTTVEAATEDTTSRRSGMDLTNNAQVYDAGAEAFHTKAPKLLSWEAVGRPALEHSLADMDLSQAQIYDGGSASGRITKQLIAMGAQPQNITGVEISPDQVALAQQDIPEAHFIVGDLSTVELPSDHFDVAVRHMVDEHLSNEALAATSRNTLDALKPGGRLVTIWTDPQRVAHTEHVTEEGPFVTNFPWGGQGTNYYREVDRSAQIIRDAGFVIDRIEELPIPDGDDVRDIDPQAYDNYMGQGYGHGEAGIRVRAVIIAHKPAVGEVVAA